MPKWIETFSKPYDAFYDIRYKLNDINQEILHCYESILVILIAIAFTCKSTTPNTWNQINKLKLCIIVKAINIDVLIKFKVRIHDLGMP